MNNITDTTELNKETLVCIKQAALQIKVSSKRAPKSPDGRKRPPKQHRNEENKIVVPPCLFLVNNKRKDLKNKSISIYVTDTAAATFDELAKKLDLSGAVVDTKNKLLSVLINTPAFAKFAQETTQKMLLYRKNTQADTAAE